MEWFNLKVSHIERLTKDSVRVDLFPMEYGEDNFGFKAGQYLTFEREIKHQLVRRSYSICSSPDEQVLSIGIKEVPEGLFSTFINRELQVGDILKASKPQGNFINIDEAKSDQNFVYIAAGSGITPILSMLKSTLLHSKDSRVTLFYGNKNLRSIMFLEEIEALKNKFLGRIQVFYVFSKQSQESDLFNGRIDGAKIDMWNNKCFSLADTNRYFLCGPEEMILGVKEVLLNKGIQKNVIHFELFTTDSGKEAREARKITEKSGPKAKKLIIQLDGKPLHFEFHKDDDNILDKALENGADLPFACKGGVCCTCKAKLVSGEVKMYVNYGLEQDEIDRGFILTCQSYPISDEVTVNFDEV